MEMFEIGKRSIPICLPESTHAYLTGNSYNQHNLGIGYSILLFKFIFQQYYSHSIML